MPPRAKEEDAMQIPARRWLRNLESCVPAEGGGLVGKAKEGGSGGRDGVGAEKGGAETDRRMNEGTGSEARRGKPGEILTPVMRRLRRGQLWGVQVWPWDKR